MTDMKKLLKQHFGHTEFRAGQQDFISHILQHQDVLGIMPTGAGKSICYQLPALILQGVTIVVSPLISLMKDQVGALISSGIPAAFINSSLTEAQCREALRRAALGAYKLIYVAPERLLTPSFQRLTRQIDISMVTVDEAHCVSQWGQDFRASYLDIPAFVQGLSKRPVVSAFTATATKEVREDIMRLLQLQKPYQAVTGFDRENLTFETCKPRSRMDALVHLMRGNPGKCGIIYCLARKTVEKVCETLQQLGFTATRYHAGLTEAERRKNQDDFIYDRCAVMVATNAFGMGIDKSNVSFVVHYNMPKNIESYYQEAGRAGRDGEPAKCILYYSPQDIHTNQFLIDQSTGENQNLTVQERDALRERDYERLRQMTFYATTGRCLRQFILEYFGETAPAYCGNCSGCNAKYVTEDASEQAHSILAAIASLAKRNRSFGRQVYANLLKGSKNQRIFELGLDSEKSYGVLSALTLSKILELMNGMLEAGLLETQGDEYPVVLPTEEGVAFLQGEKQFSLRVREQPQEAPATKKSAKKKGSPEVLDHPDLFELLRRLRTQLAEAQRVPPYVIFSNAALQSMCSLLPKTKEEFLNVSGVGEAKARLYAEPFTAVITAYLHDES